MTQLVRALVVDDEERIRLFLKEVLRREGHVVTIAANGEEALTYLENTAFDLAILDLMLGGRIDGQRVLEAIRWRWPAMVVIMMTAHGTLNSALQAIREGVDGYLPNRSKLRKYDWLSRRLLIAGRSELNYIFPGVRGSILKVARFLWTSIAVVSLEMARLLR